MNISLTEFLKLSKRYNVIPVYREISADLDTPVSCFLKLKQDRYAFLLESVEGQEKIARYSFLGCGSSLVFRSKGSRVTVVRDGAASSWTAGRDPLEEIKKLMKGFKAAPLAGLPRFHGGFVGYIGYDTVRFFEKIPDKNPDELGLPDTCLILTDTILAFDHVKHSLKIIINSVIPGGKALSRGQKAALYRQAVKRIAALELQLRKPLRAQLLGPAGSKPEAVKITSNFAKADFCGIVEKAKKFIKKGDIIQVVLSQRFKAKMHDQPFAVYRKLRSVNPSPYMFFLKLDDVTLIGSSPELLVRCEEGMIQTRPIAGTRPRGSNEQEDKALADELRADIKEKAEHLMLVDLGRNDLGRVAQLGTVSVQNFMSVERYSHVMHLVSDVVARLDRTYDAFDALRACFPAGTLSGSPKVRAMQIIDELENTRRGVYGGCVGYFSFSHAMDTCIAIRTIVVKGGYAYVQAGAGIVADSVPAKEYSETVNKAKALFEALAH